MSITVNNQFWNNVEETLSNYEPSAPIVINGKRLAERAEDYRNEKFSACLRPHQFAQEFFTTPPEQVLDLGSGMGANTRPMARNGAHVTAIDNSKKLLKIYSQLSVSDGCPKGNIRLRFGDITKMESYGENFDLVLAVDILPYVPSKDLRSTMEKIHRCLADKGSLIGTIFTTNISKITVRTLMSKMGANYYEGGEMFAVQLLEESGFSVEKLEERELGAYEFKAVKN